MKLVLQAKLGSGNEVKANYGEGILSCVLKEDITVPQLHCLLFSSLPQYDKLKFSVDSFLDLKLRNVSGESLILVLHSIHSHFTTVPFSLKTETKGRDWEIGELDESKVGHLVKALEFTKRLQETPPNLMNTGEFVGETKKLLEGSKNITIREIKGSDLEKENLNLIRAVGKASVNEPRLLIVEYRPDSSTSESSILVGKGVCYDTGGLSIKTGSYMSTMKFDMSGGAVSIGVIYALSQSNSSRNVTVLVPLVENSVSGNSYRPDDVVVSCSGKSVEIDNTDAEGRLVLADALAYACSKYSGKEIISIATLTGAIGYALGYKYAGGWSTSEDSWSKLHDSSVQAGEWLWRMPLDDYYLKALKTSRVADLKNSAKTGAGGASRAACFLREFVSNKNSYIHLDIANVAHGEKDESARAPMLRTLFYYLFEN